MGFYELWVGESGHLLTNHGGGRSALDASVMDENVFVLKEVFWAKNWTWAKAHVNDVMNLGTYVPSGWESTYLPAFCRNGHEKSSMMPFDLRPVNGDGLLCSHCVYDSIKDE